MRAKRYRELAKNGENEESRTRSWAHKNNKHMKRRISRNSGKKNDEFICLFGGIKCKQYCDRRNTTVQILGQNRITSAVIGLSFVLRARSTYAIVLVSFDCIACCCLHNRLAWRKRRHKERLYASTLCVLFVYMCVYCLRILIAFSILCSKF